MQSLLIAVTALFSAFSAWVVANVGFVGFYRQLLATPVGWQIFIDICIALVLVLCWLRADAARTGRRFWAYLMLTLSLGSIGPLLYLLLAPRQARRATAAV
jgi:hypothetical protein